MEDYKCHRKSNKSFNQLYNKHKNEYISLENNVLVY